MSTNPAPDAEPGAAPPVRPRTVDLALYAIVARCVLALASAFALFGAKAELRRNGAKLHPAWSPTTLTDKIDAELRSNVVMTLIYIGLVLLIAKYIRDGRNWARWLYAFVAFVVAGDVLRVTGFFTGENVAFRLLSGLTGVAAVMAIVLLFLPTSSSYFRPPGAMSVSPLRMLFGGRTAAVAAARTAADRAAPAGASSVSLEKAAAGRPARQRPWTGGAPSTSGKRPAAGNHPGREAPSSAGRVVPRAKSRKPAAE